MNQAREKAVALVTGGGRGIGLGIARHLAREGCDIAIADLHEPATMAGAMQEIKNEGAQALYCRADITDPAARREALDRIGEKFGRLNFLVNNAGVAPRVRADITEATEESFERLIKINLQGPYFLTQAAAGWMIRQKQEKGDFRGAIINISSISATVASTSRGDYCISKAGVSMATKLWAARLGEFDIPVYEIRPGVIKTDMTAAVTEKYDKLIAEGLCIQSRWGFPEDIGKAAAALVAGGFPYSTGQVIMVDGGMTIPRL